MAETAAENQIFSPIDDTSSIEHLGNPIRAVCALAENGPVLQSTGTRFGDISLPNYFGHYEDTTSFAVFTFDAARAVLSDPEIFSNDFWGETNEKVQGRGLFAMDPPEHTRFRTLVQQAFAPKIVNRWDSEIITPAIEEAFATVRALGQADLVRDVNLVFPYRIICKILGFPNSDMEFLSDRITRMTRGVYDMEGALKAVEEIRAYVQDYLDERRHERREDFMSALLDAEIEGDRLSDENIIAFILHLYPAGMETTYRGASNLMHLLLSNPDQFALLRSDPALIPRAIDEMLRVEGPVSMFARLVTRDTELEGHAIPKGAMVYVMHAAANRDPARWDDPHRFNIAREPKANIGFGYGAHVCIGMHLARRELEIYMNHILNDLPGLRWDPELEKIPPISGWTLRSALSLPVVWDTAS